MNQRAFLNIFLFLFLSTNIKLVNMPEGRKMHSAPIQWFSRNEKTLPGKCFPCIPFFSSAPWSHLLQCYHICYSFCLEHSSTLSFIHSASALPADPSPVITSSGFSSSMAPYHILFKHVDFLVTTSHSYNFALFEWVILWLSSTRRPECNKCLYTDHMANFQSIV